MVYLEGEFLAFSAGQKCRLPLHNLHSFPYSTTFIFRPLVTLAILTSGSTLIEDTGRGGLRSGSLVRCPERYRLVDCMPSTEGRLHFYVCAPSMESQYIQGQLSGATRCRILDVSDIRKRMVPSSFKLGPSSGSVLIGDPSVVLQKGPLHRLHTRTYRHLPTFVITW